MKLFTISSGILIDEKKREGKPAKERNVPARYRWKYPTWPEANFIKRDALIARICARETVINGKKKRKEKRKRRKGRD